MCTDGRIGAHGTLFSCGEKRVCETISKTCICAHELKAPPRGTSAAGSAETGASLLINANSSQTVTFEHFATRFPLDATFLPLKHKLVGSSLHFTLCFQVPKRCFCLHGPRENLFSDFSWHVFLPRQGSAEPGGSLFTYHFPSHL